MSQLISYLICIYIFILPIAPSKFRFKNIPINGDVILGAILVLYFLNIIFIKDTRKRFVLGLKDFFKNFNSLFVFFWICMMFISISYATDKKLAMQESIRISTYVALFFMIKYEMFKKQYIDRVIYSTIFTSIIIGVIGVYEYLKKLILEHGSHLSTDVRISSIMENSNNLGAFCILIVFPFIVLFIKEKYKRKKVTYGLISILLIINIILSFSRNAWLAFIIGYIALIFVFNFKLIYGAILGGGAVLCIPTINHRLKEVGDLSQNLSRISLWEIAIKMIKDKPLFGVGNGNYRTLYPEYYKKTEYLGYTAQQNFHPHNVYLKAQCELGIVGSVSLIGFLITSFLKVSKFSNRVNNNFYKCFYKGFTASVVAFIFMNGIDNFFSAPKVVAFFFILLAVCHSYEYNLERKSI